ncbi:MAG: histidinol dehydrogenase [Luminiphilus sp.]|nr:histidinol dehydrogenase [Luminiphilus sp.]
MTFSVRWLDAQEGTFDAQLTALQAPMAELDPELTQTVSAILQRVMTEGDEAVLKLTRDLDHHEVDAFADLSLAREDLSQALDSIDDAQRAALETAAQRIKDYHSQQLTAADWSIVDSHNSTLGQRVSALSRVGLYVPGGKASYPSSVLMNAIPAKVAGVGELTMVVPAPSGELNPVVLAAAGLAGVDRVYLIGGAQAVAALAYGTESIRAVDKIVGPGNRYVAEAKRQVFGRVGIDMIAGPSEIFVIADGSVDPKWVALDLMSQAEHDEMAQAVLISPDAAYLRSVELALGQLMETMPRRGIIEASLRNRGAFIKVQDLGQAADVSNRFGPEHLELAVTEPQLLLEQIDSAGAVFLGGYSSEALGDYCAGTNHVLPTSGAARFSSPLGVYDFQKRTSVIEMSREGAVALAEIAGVLADSESLSAHAAAARIRKPAS